MMSRRTPHGKPTHVLATVRDGGRFAAVLARARRILDLDRELGDWLDRPLRSHCRVASLHDRVVVLEVDSPVWSQRLRFLVPEIAAQLARRVVLKVRPVEAPRRHPPAAPRLSPHAASVLTELADATDNRPLGEVLRRLASRRRPEDG